MEAHFRIWNTSDPVDAAEQQRNEDIHNLQYNRNPFIDHPDLADRISSFFGTATVVVAPEIAVSPAHLDLGVAGFDTTVYGYIAVVNTGNDTLNVSSVTSTNPDFTLSHASLELAPESYAYVRVSYTSGETELSDSTTVLISSDDDDEALVEVPATVEVADLAGVRPPDAAQDFRLYQNSPNPFSRETTIAFELDRSVNVSLGLYNVRGQLVTEILSDRPMVTGRHQAVVSGEGLSPGVYYCLLTAGGRSTARRMVLTNPF
jgi:hypothetical protein